MSLRFKSLFRRMSKDHGPSSSQQGSKGVSSNPSGDAPKGKELPAKEQKGAQGKKNSASQILGPDIQPLPTVKEEKKSTQQQQQQSTKSTSKKMEGKGKENILVPTPATRTLPPPPPTNTNTDHHALQQQPPPQTTTSEHPTAAPTSSSSSTSSSYLEKNMLEKMVSDLAKNNESKKQEIAALKMEINRLKVRKTTMYVSSTLNGVCVCV